MACTRCGDNLRIFMPLPGAKTTVKRRQDLALRQIAGAAENDQIKGINWYDA